MNQNIFIASTFKFGQLKFLVTLSNQCSAIILLIYIKVILHVVTYVICKRLRVFHLF